MEINRNSSLLDFKPDYTKTYEKNWEEYRKRYYEVYSEYPPEPGKKEQKWAAFKIFDPTIGDGNEDEPWDAGEEVKNF